jgi:uncharacterized protein (DUF488 family)
MPKQIATIGYEGLLPADFLHILRNAGIARLVDVRAIANSRRPGYAKRALAAALESAGIEYVHLPTLGTPAEGRAAVRSGHPERMRRIFASHLAKPEQQEALAALARSAAGRPTCLLCLEADPAHCHRTLIAEALHDGWDFTIRHLAAEPG